MTRTTRDPRGYALIELLVLITVMTVMLGLSATMIHLLLRLDRVERDASSQAADLARLATDFRDDIHAMLPGAPDSRTEGDFALDLAGGRTVRYEVRPEDLVRTVREGARVRHREIYRRPARGSVRFEKTTEGTIPVGSLILGVKPGAKGASEGREVRVDAVLGLDIRHSPRAE